LWLQNLLMPSNRFSISDIFIVYTFYRTKKIKYRLCVLFFNIFYIVTIVFTWAFFSPPMWSNVQLHYPIVSWFNVILRVYEVLNWKTSTECYWEFFLSISHQRKRRLIHATSSSYVLRVASDVTDIHHRHHLSPFFAQSISRLPCNITPRTNSFYVVWHLLYVLGSVSTAAQEISCKKIIISRLAT